MPSLGASIGICGRHKHSEHSTCLSGMFNMRKSHWWEFGLVGFHLVLYQVFLVNPEPPTTFHHAFKGPLAWPSTPLTTFPAKDCCYHLLAAHSQAVLQALCVHLLTWAVCVRTCLPRQLQFLEQFPFQFFLFVPFSYI